MPQWRIRAVLVGLIKPDAIRGFPFSADSGGASTLGETFVGPEDRRRFVLTRALPPRKVAR